MTRYRLYYSPSTASLAVRWMLMEVGAPFDLDLVDFATRQQRSPEFLAVNPSGHVPVLVVDGRPYTEVAAILMLLAERHPEAGLAPEPGAPERPDYLSQMVFMANTLQPPFRAWYYPDEPAGPGQEEAVKARAAERIAAIWARYDDRFSDGRPFVLGERRSVADLLLTMLTRWGRNLPITAAAFPHLKRYMDRMRATPALREVHRLEGLTDWIDD